MNSLLGVRRSASLISLAVVVVACSPSATVTPPPSPAPSSTPNASPAATPSATQPGSSSPATASASPTATAVTPSSSPTPSATTSVPPTPAITGLEGRIIYTKAGRSFGDETVFSANIDGSDEIQLSQLDRSGGPWATRDGSRINYSTANQDGRLTMVVSNVDGTDSALVPLPEGSLNIGSGPFSPDGQQVLREAFSDQDETLSGIYVSKVDGAGIKRLTTIHYIAGDWSPDGQHILLFDNNDTGEGPPPAGALFVAEADGTNVVQLTPDDASVQCCFNYRYSPDGTKVLFANPDGSLWTIDSDGSNLTQVFKDPDGDWAITPTWSPDGKMILFALDPIANPFEHPLNQFFVTYADGTGLTQVLGTAQGFKREPVWVAAP
jgi:Tol biopolymer transport system component